MTRDHYDDVCMVRRCLASPMDRAPIPICFRHLREIGSMYEVMYDVALNPNIAQRASVEDQGSQIERDRTERGVVYYLRMGDHVKIGTSTDLAGRMRGLYVPPEALLATEKGSYPLEARRHAEFSAERVNPRRELFNPSPRLLTHIDNLRRLNGLEPLAA